MTSVNHNLIADNRDVLGVLGRLLAVPAPKQQHRLVGFPWPINIPEVKHEFEISHNLIERIRGLAIIAQLNKSHHLFVQRQIIQMREIAADGLKVTLDRDKTGAATIIRYMIDSGCYTLVFKGLFMDRPACLLDTKDGWGCTPLHSAVAPNCSCCVTRSFSLVDTIISVAQTHGLHIINKQNDLGQTPLYRLMTRDCNIEMTQKLLRCGADPNLLGRVSVSDNTPETTPLYELLENRFIHVLKEGGLPFGNSLKGEELRDYKMKVLELLIDYKADLNQKNAAGQTTRDLVARMEQRRGKDFRETANSAIWLLGYAERRVKLLSLL